MGQALTLVDKFHAAFGLARPSSPPLRPDPALVRLRARLIREEYEEVMSELATLANLKDPAAINDAYQRLLKELADLRYVVEGCAVAFGLPIEEAFSRVHASNMSKLGSDGKPIYRADGKVIKGPNYAEADVAGLVQIIDHEEEHPHDRN